MAKMLAARRPAVSGAAHELRRNGVIDYQRGTLTVLDRRALEQTACACYQIIRNAYALLYALERVLNGKPLVFNRAADAG